MDTPTRIDTRAIQLRNFLESFCYFVNCYELRVLSILEVAQAYIVGQSDRSCVYGYGYVSNTVIDCNISKTILYLDRNYIELLPRRALGK